MTMKKITKNKGADHKKNPEYQKEDQKTTAIERE